MTKKSLYTRVLLVIGVIVFINLIANEFSLRMDFTQNKEYTLNEATKNILKNLEDPITIKAYFSEDMPPQIQKIKRNFQELLVEYATISDGKVVYNFIDPTEDEKIEKEAIENGVTPVNINVREKNEMKVQKAFLGAVIHFGDKKEAIPMVSSESSLEYLISTAIKRVSNSKKIKLGIYNTNMDINSISESIRQLSVLYDMKVIDLGEKDIDSSIKTLIIINPLDSVINKTKLDKLDEFLDKGGRLFIAFDNIKSDFQGLAATKINSKLTEWLLLKNIKVNYDAILDMKCSSINVQQQQGNYIVNNQIPFPYVFFVQDFSSHPISKGLTNIPLQFISTVNYLGDTTKTKYTPLMYSSINSSKQSLPIKFDLDRQWNKNDFKDKKIPIGMALSGEGLGNINSKMVIIPSGTFPIEQNNQVAQDNLNLLINSIDWLSDDTGLIDLRTKTVSFRGIDDMDNEKKEFLKYLNLLMPILLVILLGLFRFQFKKKQSLKRKHERYE